MDHIPWKKKKAAISQQKLQFCYNKHRNMQDKKLLNIPYTQNRAGYFFYKRYMSTF
jgi:hypothetical protein